MQITVKDETRVIEVVDEFNRIFPFLKLEFHFLPNGHPGQLISNVQQTFRMFRKESDNNRHVDILPDMTVVDLDRLFREAFGISAQVFRKSGTIWLKATLTDKWTLEEQNRLGGTISGQLSKPRKE